MTKQLLIYESAVPVTVARHREVSVKAGDSFAHTAEANVVPILSTEVVAALRDFPIVFAGDDRPMPVAILGVREAENLFVGADGSWLGRYVPAFFRQYPFVLAGEDGSDVLTLCVDEAFEGVNRSGRGERLFDADGERTIYLQGVVNFVQSYQRDFGITRRFCDRLKELDLFEPMEAQLRLADGQIALRGFYAINRQRLKELPDNVIAELVRNDGIEVIYGHLHSMANLDRLVELSSRRSERSPETTGMGPADAEESAKA